MLRYRVSPSIKEAFVPSDQSSGGINNKQKVMSQGRVGGDGGERHAAARGSSCQWQCLRRESKSLLGLYYHDKRHPRYQRFTKLIQSKKKKTPIVLEKQRRWNLYAPRATLPRLPSRMLRYTRLCSSVLAAKTKLHSPARLE